MMLASNNSSIYFLITNCSAGDYPYIFYCMGSVVGKSLIFILPPNPRLGRTLLGSSLGNMSLYSNKKDLNSPLCHFSQAKSYVTHPLGICGCAYDKSFKYSKGLSAVLPNGLQSSIIVPLISGVITCFSIVLRTY